MKPFEKNMEEGMEKPLLAEATTRAPMKQIYSGYEIEKRFLLMTIEEDTSKNKNGLLTYNEVLEKGTHIKQGYIKDIQVAKNLLITLGIALDFRPNTIRLRQYGLNYILTVKDRKDVKKREVEWELDRKTFREFWPLTKGARIEKKRLVKKIKGFEVEFDAFTDRFLLIAEIEVDKKGDLDILPKLGMDITGNSAWSNKQLSR